MFPLLALHKTKTSVDKLSQISQYESPCGDYTSVNASTSATPPQNKSKLKKPVRSWLWMCAFIFVGSAAFASLALTVWNSSQVNHQSAKLEMVIMQLQNSLNDSASELERIVQIQNSLNDRVELYNLLGRDSINPASSCFHVLLFNSSSPSGHYWIRSSNGSAVHVYCDFNRQCGCDGPSTWIRMVFY